MKTLKYCLLLFIALITSCKTIKKQQTLSLENSEGVKPRNIIFILTDDHRYDFMGFTGKVPWLETPNLDRLASEGAHIKNAFVTTALCSPSRASILTGLYSHKHKVVDNSAPMPDDLVFFPQYLQKGGYETAFLGKWHMGNRGDEPQPGFDHWESFKGQGRYFNPTLNINGERVSYGDSTYISDLLTDHAVDWLKNQRDKEKPFFLFLSHKAVHSEFRPAPRHKGEYANEKISYPPSYNTPKYNITVPPTINPETGKPKTGKEFYGENMMPNWVKNQRESWHGVDYMYHGAINFEQFFKAYCETLLGVDDSVGEILDYLEEAGLDKSTLVVYMGDNGFSFGEHGLIDKRHFYEESVRVPLLARCPELFDGGTVVENMVQNIDIAPTLLAVAGLEAPEYIDGESFLPLLQGKEIPWRDKIFYEYYWEFHFPQTPTMHGVRSDRYKFIRYHGIWDTNEFYDLKEDPYEMHNLIKSPQHQEIIKGFVKDLYDWMESTNGMQIPLKRTESKYIDHRNKNSY